MSASASNNAGAANAGAANAANNDDPCNDLPYNLANVLIQQADVEALLTRYGLPAASIKDLSLFRNAFVHKSYCTRKNENFINGNTNCPPGCLPLQEESNERLEFLGDAVLGLITGQYLFDRYPDENEGFLTKMRTKLVNGVMLAELSAMLGLNKFVLISKQIEEGNGRTNRNILEDAFEAFLGAIFLNTSYQDAYHWLTTFLEDTVDFADLLLSNSNFKDAIMKYFQHTYNQAPRFYELSTDTTATGAKAYRVCLKDRDGKIVSVGAGANKKQAENDCARQALAYFGQL